MIFTHLSIPAAAILASLSSCPDQGKVAVHVTVKKVESPYVINLDIKQLTKMKNPGHNHKTIGLTKGRIHFDQQAAFYATVQKPSGVTCFVMTSYTMAITYSPQIHIASELKKNSCRYNIVVAHEKKHVAIDEKILKEYLAKFEKKITEVVAKLGPRGPFPRKLLDQEQRDLLNEVTGELRPLKDKMESVRTAQQAKLDTVSNYRREKALCPAN